MRLFQTNKVVLSIQNGAAQFLNGLTSNEISAPQNAFLNIHGRIIATFDQLQISDEKVLVVLEAGFTDRILEHLLRYAKLGGVLVEKLSERVYFDLDSDADLSNGDLVIPQKKGRLLISSSEKKAGVREEEFRLFRLKNNIPLQGVDFNDEMLLNVSITDFVSFTKGCYLGQEPVSKVYNRAKPSWKLVVKSEEECSQEERQKMTSKIKDPESGKVLGFIFVANKQRK